MEILAPAKVNLALAVKGVRPDGFHEIETLMTPITIFDRLEIEARDDGDLVFRCDDLSLPAGNDNLVVRAASLFCTEIGLQPHLQIALHKKIPHGAGLGGGSSDAAATLLGLDRLFQTELPKETLISMGAELGSDVPFFVSQSVAICRGRGEQVTPVPFPHTLPLLLIKPPFGVKTGWAYQRWREAFEIPDVSYSRQRFDWGELANDLERPVFEKYFFLALLKNWLLDQPEVAGALMSGSGSTLFALLREENDVAALANRLEQQFGSNLWLSACETIGDRE